jgi:MFS family permease
VTAVGFYLLTIARSFAPLTAYLVLNMTGGSLLRPAINSTVSKRTSAGQGATIGMLGSFDSLGRIAGPVWAGAVYRLGVNLPFLTGAAITAVGLMLAAFILPRLSSPAASRSEPLVNNPPPAETSSVD